MVKQQFRRLLDKIPYVKQLHKEIAGLKYSSLFQPGHFYSPIPLLDDVKSRENELWNNAATNKPAAINFNDNDQLKLLEQLSAYYSDIPFSEEKQQGLRYYYNNDYYSYADAIMLFTLMRHYKPKQIVEIGSGFSSAVMLDTNEFFFDNTIQLTFIEPYTERLNQLITEKDKHTVTTIQEKVQNVSSNVFTALNSGDFLFIDSSHVSKTGSDVNHIMFNILPCLKSGVFIHFHDIFYPFEYPKSWVFEGRNWNEDYFLRAFLMYNKTFEVLFFTDYIHRFYPKAFSAMPLCYKNSGGNFWMTKITKRDK